MGGVTMMTLEEAIKHCEEKACSNDECSKEHKQLAEWLKELQALKANINYKEIEERALDYAKKWGLDHYSPLFDVCQEDYRVGAFEQKAIDDAEIRELKSLLEKEMQIG